MTTLNVLNVLKSKAKAALFYAKLGWAVLPLHNIVDGACSCGKKDCSSPGKHPRTPHGVKDASNDPDQVKAWWVEWPKANIGIAAGKTSGLFILDIDGPKGIELVKSKDVELVNGTLPIIKTGSGKGYHLYFKPFLETTPNGVRVADEVDIRGDDGYGILPPSDHISGERYEWVTNPTDVIPEAPTWLRQLIAQDKTSAPEVVAEAIPEGRRNDELMSIAGTMRRRGLVYEEILAALKKVNQKRCIPPLRESELRQIAKSVSRYHPKKDRGQLNQLVEDHQPSIKLRHITEIEDPKYLTKKVTVPAIVSSTAQAYAVPSKVKGLWYDEDLKQEQTRDIRPKDPTNMALAGASASFKYGTLCRLFPEAGRKTKVEDLSYRTVYTLRVRPPVFGLKEQDGRIVDDEGYEYKQYGIYVVSNSQIQFPASTYMVITGYVLPDPKTQKTTLLVTRAEFPEDVEKFNPELLGELAVVYADKSPVERFDWLLDNFELYSHIVGRRNIAKATFLGFFTPLTVTIDGETERGWANVLIIGDTTSAKTKTVRLTIVLLKAGMIITAETASTVGLTGAAVQLDGSGWGIDWGALVLNDRKLLAIDGANKLDKAKHAELAESERTGKVKIVKAAKDEAYARTRQIKIANPVNADTKKTETMNLGEFYYPIQAAATFLDLVSVARLDLAVFADSEDVKPEEINKRFTEEPDPRLHLLGEALKWAWSNTAEIVFTDEAIDEIHTKATELHKRFFYKQIPLASIDLKWKIARLAASAATLTLNTEDFREVRVEKPHVQMVADFMKKEYETAGLHTIVEHNRHETIDDEIAMEALTNICITLGHEQPDTPDLKEAFEILNWIAVQGRFTKDQLKAQFELARDNQLHPLIATLSTQDLIKRGSGYYATTQLNKLCRYILTASSFSMISTFRVVKKETPSHEKDPQTRLPTAGQQEAEI